MLFLKSVTALALLSACACTPQPQWLPIPLQREFAPGSEPRAVAELVEMSNPEVDTYIVNGVLGGERGSSWRWANPRAELRFHLATTKDLKFFIDFAIADTTWALTGPLHMQFLVDGKRLGAMNLDSPGQKHFEAPVEEALLKADRPVVVAAEVDKFYTSSTDGTKLGFMLIRMGFKPR